MIVPEIGDDLSSSKRIFLADFGFLIDLVLGGVLKSPLALRLLGLDGAGLDLADPLLVEDAVVPAGPAEVCPVSCCCSRPVGEDTLSRLKAEK